MAPEVDALRAELESARRKQAETEADFNILMASVEGYKEGTTGGSEAELREQLEALRKENDHLGVMVAEAEGTCAALREEAAALRSNLQEEQSGES